MHPYFPTSEVDSVDRNIGADLYVRYVRRGQVEDMRSISDGLTVAVQHVSYRFVRLGRGLEYGLKTSNGYIEDL
jgi:hypothetical protein